MGGTLARRADSAGAGGAGREEDVRREETQAEGQRLNSPKLEMSGRDGRARSGPQEGGAGLLWG